MMLQGRWRSFSVRNGVCRSARYQQRRRLATAHASDDVEIFDVVCVGGGPAGLTLLSALRSSPVTSSLKVALVESQDLSRARGWRLPEDQYSNRVSSLTPASVAFLKETGVWGHIDALRVQPFQQMSVWDGVTGASISFDWPGQPTSSPTIAYMTENLNLTSALLRRLDDLGGVSIFDKTKVEHITLGQEGKGLDLSTWPILSTSGGQKLAARLLVGADGAHSPVRTFAGITNRGWDYERHGLVATLRTEAGSFDGHNVTAYQRFLPTGPVALLPLPDNMATLVWSTLPQHASFLKSLSPEDFIQMVNAAFRLSVTDLEYMHTISSGQADEFAWRKLHSQFDPNVVPSLICDVQEGTRASFPLRMRHADTYVGPRVALVGDAAHTMHPLAGQGLNQGQADVQVLARVLSFAVDHGQDVGDILMLERYFDERYAANNAILGTVDKLHKLYSVSSGPLVPLRSLGLRAVDALTPVKHFFMNQAAGKGSQWM